jgi:hypothetical protein
MSDSQYIRFKYNVPEEIVLQSASGKDVTGQFGPQVCFGLQDGRKLYAEPVVAHRIAELKVQPGERITITKREAKAGNARVIEWHVHRLDQPQPVAKILNGAENLDGHEVSPVPRKPMTRLEDALRTALEAARGAEKYSQEIGHPVAFDKNDIRLMAQTLVINQSRERVA